MALAGEPTRIWKPNLFKDFSNPELKTLQLIDIFTQASAKTLTFVSFVHRIFERWS